MRLSEAVKAAGWRLVIYEHPWRHPDALGDPTPRAGAAALSNGRIACKADNWRYAYSVSHEIAEVDFEHRHCSMLWRMQANLLAFWHELRAGRRDRKFLRLLRAMAPRAESRPGMT